MRKWVVRSLKQKRVLAIIEASFLIGTILSIYYQTIAPKVLVLKPEASKVISKPSQSSSSQALPNDHDTQTIGGSSTTTPKTDDGDKLKSEKMKQKPDQVKAHRIANDK